MTSQESSYKPNPLSISASSSLRELLDSLSKEQFNNQELLGSLGFALRSFTNLHRFLELVPVVASQLVGVEGAFLIPFQPNGKLWREQFQAIPFEKCQELFRQLVITEEEKNSIFSEDEKQLLALDRFVQRYMDKTAVFSTSIVSRGNQRGRLYIFDPSGDFVWSETYAKHLQLIADLTGVAMENDLIFRQIRLHEGVDRQLSIGGEIQAQLLPDHCPIIEGVQLAACCRPAFQVGGDYYDFMPTRPDLKGRSRETGRWSLVIGDVMGKGIPAGLLMTMLRGMLRAEVLSGLPPDKILHDLNQLALNDLTQSHRFVTLFYSDFDSRSRKLRYANAAHNPPLLWTASKRSISRLDVPGLLIGLQQDAEYICGEVILEPGDILLYYTDGVTEAPGISGERFTESRLISILEDCALGGSDAQSIVDRIFKRLDGYVGAEHELEDDASIVVLKVDEDLILPNLNKTRD